MYTHLDLFSGIGGFALGLQRTGKFKTIAFCEYDEFCHRVLRKNFGNVPIIKDIKSFDTERFIHEHGRPFIITGGFPCQGFSQANANREGTSNSKGRDLWPQMHRIIKDLKPKYIIGENVSGFATFPLAFERTATDLEASGYQTVCFNIPACAANSLKHQRQRLWIIAHSISSNGRRWRAKSSSRNDRKREFYSKEEEQTTHDLWSKAIGCNTFHGEEEEKYNHFAQGYKTQSRLGGELSDGLSDRMDSSEFGVPRVTTEKQDRAARLKAIGNAVVPTIPEIIARAIIEAEGD